jgi:integrase
MARKKLTDKGIENLAAPRSGRVELWDAGFGEGAFGLRVTEKGTKTFQLMYRFEGKLRRKTIGQYPTIGLGKAHDAARDIIRKAKAGVDPELAEAALAVERTRARANTFGAVANDFIERYAKQQNRSWEEVKEYFDRDLVDWHKRPIASITRRDVNEAIRHKAAKVERKPADKETKTKAVRESGGPYAANRLLANTRKLFSWAVEQEYLTASPVVSVSAPGAEQERERVLTDDEVKALWKAWEAMEAPFGPMLQLLLVTAQRRDEVAGLRWADLDIENKLWTIPGEFTKPGRSHEVPLSPIALAILEPLLRTTSPYVFPARGNPDNPASGFSRAKARSDKLSKVTGWRIHDLRRTAGTGMASAGIAVSTISRVLNHAEGGVTKIYNRYSYGQEKRHALETWARKLEGIIRKPAENVVELRAAE